MKTTPIWTVTVLQGLAFWIGHKNQYFGHYNLTEGAIVGEALGLLNGKTCGQKLLPEILYRDLLKNGKDVYTKQDRVDIVIVSTEPKKAKLSEISEEVIEVKRYSAGITSIKKDMNRLGALLSESENADLRCFVLVVSEGKYPKEYMSNKDRASTKKISLDNGCEAYVRRVCKSTSSFKRNAYKKAHYACLIEVVRTKKK